MKHDRDTLDKMATAATSINSPTTISRLSWLWGYPTGICVPEQTIASRQRAPRGVGHEHMQSGEHPTHSPEVVEALCQLADKSELESEESVTEDLQSKLAAQGHQVNTAWIRTTLHSEGYSLRSVRPRSCEELDEETTKQSILLFWREWEILQEGRI